MPGQRQIKARVTLRDVADAAGVSIKTVSNVLNDWPYVRPETRQRVQAVIESLDYRPNALAASLRTGRTNSIGVIIPDITNPIFGQIVRGCEAVLYARGYSILLCNTNEEYAKEQSYLDTLVRRGVDGVLMFGTHADAELVPNLARFGVPIVAEDAPIHHPNTTTINIENVRGAELAASHLVGLGHRRIAYLGGPELRFAAQQRREGYAQVLAKAGLESGPALTAWGNPSIGGGYSSAIAMLGRSGQEPITAFVCYNDLVAVGCMLACQERGLHVPEDVAIVGFDDITLASLVTPALTTVRVHQLALGRLAAELLLERMENGEMLGRCVHFPVELVVRRSCGAQQPSSQQFRAIVQHLAEEGLLDLDPATQPANAANTGNTANAPQHAPFEQ